MTGWSREQVAEYTGGRSLSEVDVAAAEELAPHNATRLLELGCGPGTVAAHILRSHSKPEALFLSDISPAFLPEARRATALEGDALVLAADPAGLPLAAGAVDRVLAMATLHHMTDGGIACALGEAARVLIPGGRLVLVEDWAFEDERGFESLARRIRAIAGHRENHKTAEEWLGLAGSAGLRPLRQRWVPRPFRLPEDGGGSRELSRLLERARRWPESRRTVRMWIAVLELPGAEGR